MSNSTLEEAVQSVTEVVNETARRAFDYPHRRAIRITGIVSSSISIISGLCAFYFLGMVHPKKRVYRHNLIFMLIIYDFIKALALLIYPAVAEATRESIMDNVPFRNALGWFTCFSIEGGDFIILCFAVHIALLIFFPNMKFKFYNHNRLITSNPQEGGLFPFRIYLYLTSLIFPSVISSVGYVPSQGYKSGVNWSFLVTVRPVWYFTWIFRYCIVILIISMYVGTYVHVTRQYKVVSSKMNLQGAQKQSLLSTLLGDSIWYKMGKFIMMLVFPDVQISAKLHGRALNTKADMENIQKLHVPGDINFNEDPFSNSQGTSSTNNTYSVGQEEQQDQQRQQKEQRQKEQQQINQQQNQLEPDGSVDVDQLNANSDEATEVESTESEKMRRLQRDVGLDIQRMLHREAMDRFEVRRVQIMKQMKVIFVYPVSYILLWMFPFIHQCYILRHDGKVTWSSYTWYAMAAFFQAFNCTIDTLVFLYRERPWTLTVARVDPGMRFSYSLWRHWLSFLPGYHLNEQCTSTSNSPAGNEKRTAKRNESNAGNSVPSSVNTSTSTSTNTNAAGSNTQGLPHSEPMDLEAALSGIQEEKESDCQRSGAEVSSWLPAMDLNDEDVSDFVRVDTKTTNGSKTRCSADSRIDPNDSYVSLRDFLNHMAGPEELQSGQPPEQRKKSKVSESSLMEKFRRENKDRRNSKFSWRTFPFRGSFGGPVKKSTSTNATAP